MNDQQQKSIKDTVLGKIKSREVKMRPQYYFVLKTALVILSIFFVALFVLYLVSLIAFILRASGIWFLPGLGFSGMKVFLTSLPWVLILIAVASIVVLEMFAKRFTFVYRRPIFYSIFIIIIFVILGSFIIEKTRFHSDLFWKAKENSLPVAGKLYRDFDVNKFKEVHRGAILEITEDGFYLEKPDGQTLNIVITSDTKLLFKKEIEKGNQAVVMGKECNGVIYALVVKKVNDNAKFFQRSPIKKHLNK